MPQISLTSGTVFTGSSGISILDAATRAGIFFPYSCKTGRCSTCKCKVLSGQTRELHTETGLAEHEKAEGWILGCVRSAETDVTIEVDDLGGVVLPAVKTIPCRISHIHLLAPDVIQVKLRLPPNTEFSFIPGQYIDVIGPGGVRRSYSLANASFADKHLDLHIRAVDGGAMSQYWFGQAKANDLLRLNGPLGTFFLRDVAGVDLVFLATGTGFAPVKAMLESIRDLASAHAPRSVTVLWGGRTPQDIYFDVESISGDFSFIPVLSRADEQWSGVRGHVQQALLSALPDLQHAAVYACGSDAMIRDARATLVSTGLPANRFYSDAFVSSGNV
jgi:CDP-4-dehydro-6-deoxyglucose reductase